MLTIRRTGETNPDNYYPVALATEKVDAAVARWYDAADHQLPHRDDDDLGDWAAHERVPQPRPRIGTLFWPVTGARRWARGDFLLSQAQLAALRLDLAYTNAVTLAFTDAPDGADAPREFKMYLVNARPLVDNTDSATDDLYVITVVDDRYYWQFQSGLRDTFNEIPGSWSQLISWAAARLGETISTGTIASAFAAPDPTRWLTKRTQGRPTAHLLDSMLAYVGHRLVWLPDGTGRTAPASAERAAALAFHAANLDRHHGGGVLEITERANAVPAEIVHYFQPVSSSDGVVTKALSGLAIGAYGSHTGTGAGKVVAWMDLPQSAGTTDKGDAATQWATAWYLWQLSGIDASYAGFTTVPDSAMVSHVEYRHTRTEGMTWVKPYPPNYSNLLGHPFYAKADDAGGGGGLLVEVTVSSSGYHTVKRKTWSGGVVVDYSPLTTYTTCRASVHTTLASNAYAIPVGTLCEMVPIPDLAGDYWISPTGDYATYTTPGLVSTFPQGYSGTKYFANGVVVSDGAYCAMVTTGGTYAPPPLRTYWFCTNGTGLSGYNTIGVAPGVGTPGNPGYSSGFVRFGQDSEISTSSGEPTRGYPDGGNSGPPVTSASGFTSPNGFHWASAGGSTGALRTGSMYFLADGGGTGYSDASWTTYNSPTGFFTNPSGGLVTPTANQRFNAFTFFDGLPKGPRIYTVAPDRLVDAFGSGAFPGTPPEPDGGLSFVYSPHYATSAGASGAKRMGVTSGSQGYNRSGSVGNTQRTITFLGKYTGNVYDPSGPDYYIELEVDNGLVTHLTNAGQVALVNDSVGTKTLRPSNPYYADDAVTPTVFYLNPMAKAGEKYEITGRGAAGWKIAQYAGMQIKGYDPADSTSTQTPAAVPDYVAPNQTTAGATGYLSGGQYSTVLLECLTDGTEFLVLRYGGQLYYG